MGETVNSLLFANNVVELKESKDTSKRYLKK